MLKKACTFGLLAAATVVSFSTSVRADELTSVQRSNQESATIGDYNQTSQITDQFNQQQQKLFPIGGAPDSAASVQDAEQKTGVVGIGNRTGQLTEQVNSQGQTRQPSIILPVLPH